MISKNLKIIGVLCALFLSIGCLGSGAENNAKVNTDNAKVNTDNVQAETVQVQNDNTAWIQSQARYCGILGPELSSAGNAATNNDFETMVIYGEKIESDAAAAFNESQSYNVSPRYIEAKQNWEIALINYQEAGKCIKIVGTEKGSNQKSIQDVVYYCETGNEYFNQCKNSM